METCFESKLNRVMPNGTLRGVRGRGNYSIFLPTRLLRLNYGLYCNKRSPFLKKFRKRRSFILIDLKERYVSEDECRQAIAEYDKDKQPDE